MLTAALYVIKLALVSGVYCALMTSRGHCLALTCTESPAQILLYSVQSIFCNSEMFLNLIVTLQWHIYVYHRLTLNMPTWQ